jgi:hypothetical protein
METINILPMQPEIQNAWKKTCSIIFGEEIGQIEDYEEWLKGMIDPPQLMKSHISGKEVAVGIREYAPDSKFIGMEEIDYGKKFEKLDINEIKDIDSLVEALSDRFDYCGNIVLGNSINVERSTNISDCSYAYDVAQFRDSKFLAHCTVGRVCSHIFGVYGPGDSEFCIRCTQTYQDRRCFELWMSQNCSDCYYIYNLDGCSNCIFSFNLRNKRNCIGNLEIDREKYASIRNKLVGEIREELKKNKKLPSLIDIVESGKFVPPPKIKINEKQDATDVAPIEREFSKTTEILFGKKLAKMEDYSDWLYTHAHRITEIKSAVSGKTIRTNMYVIFQKGLPDKRVVDVEEALELGRILKMAEKDVESLSLKNASERISKLAYFNAEFNEGKNDNMVECTLSIDCSNCYRASATVRSKFCGCGMWPTSCENCFGFDSIFFSNFSMNCYHSVKLMRCFEMDNCRDCADSMFCHNCEGLSNCMFCFNVKSKRYAIGNVEVSRDEYARIKKIVMDEIGKKLEKDNKIEWSIYNIGSRK